MDLLYEDRWLFCSWQCSACPSPHPCQELLFVTSRTAGGQISCDMLNLCHKTIICIPTNLDQLLTSKQAKNRSPFDAFRPVEAIWSAMFFEMVFDDNQINFATTSSAELNCRKRIAKILFSFIPFMKYDLAKCETGMWQESAFQNFNNLTNLSTFKFLPAKPQKTHPKNCWHHLLFTPFVYQNDWI